MTTIAERLADAGIEVRQRRMFWAPTRRRHYATLHSACRGEANAIIRREWFEEGGEGLWSDHPEWCLRRAKLVEEIEQRFLSALQVKP